MFPAYAVSNLGNVKRVMPDRLARPMRQLKWVIGSAGRPEVGLYRDGKHKVVRVHQLVAEAFLGPRPAGAVIRHLDGDVLNAAASNLAYGTPRENEADKLQHGTSNRGERHGMAKLSLADVLSIRADRRKSGVLAAQFSVSPRTIRDIKMKRTWAHAA